MKQTRGLIVLAVLIGLLVVVFWPRPSTEVPWVVARPARSAAPPPHAVVVRAVPPMGPRPAPVTLTAHVQLTLDKQALAPEDAVDFYPWTTCANRWSVSVWAGAESSIAAPTSGWNLGVVGLSVLASARPNIATQRALRTFGLDPGTLGGVLVDLDSALAVAALEANAAWREGAFREEHGEDRAAFEAQFGLDMDDSAVRSDPELLAAKTALREDDALGGLGLIEALRTNAADLAHDVEHRTSDRWTVAASQMHRLSSLTARGYEADQPMAREEAIRALGEATDPYVLGFAAGIIACRGLDGLSEAEIATVVSGLDYGVHPDESLGGARVALQLAKRHYRRGEFELSAAWFDRSRALTPDDVAWAMGDAGSVGGALAAVGVIVPETWQESLAAIAVGCGRGADPGRHSAQAERTTRGWTWQWRSEGGAFASCVEAGELHPSAPQGAQVHLVVLIRESG